MFSKKWFVIMTVGVLLGLSSAAYTVSQDIAVSQASDDAEENSGGGVNLSSSDLELVQESSNQTVGIRFNGVNIPRSSSVTNAYIQFTCDETNNQNPCNLIIQGQAADNASTFSTSENNISSRRRTSASVKWSPPDWNSVGMAGPGQRTPKLSSIIQEIVNRPGWSQGNSVVFIITGTGKRVAEAYGGGETVLHLEWSVGALGHIVEFAAAASSGPEDCGTASINVNLSSAVPAATVTVDYAVRADGTTAESPADYTLLGDGTLTFAPGDTMQTIDIAIVDDILPEPGEKIIVVLSNPRNASLGNITEHTYTINPSDVPPDWPMWRYDANRSGASPIELPPTLYLQWVLVLPPLEPAWPDEERITFDHYYAPIVLGKKMFVSSSRNDKVTAYNIDTGAEIWRFYAGAPIRMAPAGQPAQNPAGKPDRLFVACDDGYLYCLNAEDGALLWKFRGAPTDRKVLGNKRLVSAWPARGAPTILDGNVYFAAGIWPFMGSFVYALDAATGEVVWVNDGSGSIYMNQPHGGSVSFGALAPQGYLVAIGDRLMVPNGRAVAAGLDRNTGEFLYFHFQENNKNSTNHVAAFGDYFNNCNSLFSLSDGSMGGSLPDGAIMTESGNYAQTSGRKVFCKAGDRLYAGSSGSIVATENENLRWQKSITVTPACMLAGDNKLIVVTMEGRIYCYGGTRVWDPPEINKVVDTIAWPAEDQWTTKAQAVLAATGTDEGYCLVLGVGTGRLMEELARQYYLHKDDYPYPYDLRIIGLDPDAAKIETLRQRWDDMGVPSERLSAFVGDICTEQLPPYLAHLIVSEDLLAAGADNGDTFVEKVFYSLRPYGGKVCFSSDALELLQQGAANGLANADVTISGDFALLERVGALPGSADWTHNYADASNSVVSKDELVKAPLGLLWFGGSTHGGESYNRILPRHGHGPSEQVVGGRLFIEGPNIMRALDVYTGRVLWEAELPGVGVHYDYITHVPGANAIGSNYASVDDGVYVCNDTECRRLEPKNGATIGIFVITDPTYGDAVFSQVKIWDDLLVVAADPVPYNGIVGHSNYSEASSRDLVVMNRFSGTILWERRANHSFHHNTIIVGNDILYCIDRIPPDYADALSRRGVNPGDVGAPWELLALDVRTGKKIWSTTRDVFGTWLSYSEEYDVLLQSGRASRDMVSGEPTRQIAYDGSKGTKLWEKNSEGGPCLLHGDIVIEQRTNGGNACNILTGKTYMREHPITGTLVPWSFSRTYGCNTAVGCKYLLTFRSGAAGYYDMLNDSGTGNFGGFKSGCSSNLIPANGVLNSPDYTRTCTCGYQNQTSLAMVYMPEAEMWTYTSIGQAGGSVKKVGINFGAPGDRLADNGVLWLDYPSVGGSSPDIGVTCVPTSPQWFRHHAARFDQPGVEPSSAGESLGWVTASGAIGLTKVTVPLNNEGEAEYVVRLYFAEPENAEVGQRVFDVAIQGRKVLNNFDIAQHAGSDGSGIVREFRGIQAEANLTLTLTPVVGQPVICGIEVLASN
jgi:outer membrane protein assembly factor BamB